MNRQILISLCFFLTSICALHGQYSEMVGKPYSQRLDAISRLYSSMGQTRVDKQLIDTLAGMRQLAKLDKNIEMALEADLLEAFYRFRHSPISSEANIDALEVVIEKALRSGVLHIACRGTMAIAKDHWWHQRYQKMFRSYARVDSMLHHISTEEFPNKTDYLYAIGDAYYHFGDYQTAIAYFHHATDRPPTSFFENSWKHAMNTMGLAYVKLDDLQHADSCFVQILDHNTVDSEVWEGIVAGNLGYNYFLRGQYEEAVPLLTKDILIAEKYRDLGLAAGSVTVMADMLTRQHNLTAAKIYIDKAYAYIQASGQTDRLRVLYPVMSQWHMAYGNRSDASQYLDSALIANKRYNEKFNALLLMRADQELMAIQRESALHELRMSGQQEINKRNLIVAALIILVMAIMVLTYRRRQRNILKMKEQDLQLLRADHELQEVRRQLDELARSVSRNHEKNEQLNNGELIEQLNQQVVLTDEGWDKFSRLFAKLYPGFQHRLKEQCPSLTPAEMRCLAMEKLHYTNKEMGALQGISSNAVTVTKFRIRKKLGFSKQEELTEFVNSI